jgi:hypothetical protein
MRWNRGDDNARMSFRANGRGSAGVLAVEGVGWEELVHGGDTVQCVYWYSTGICLVLYE